MTDASNVVLTPEGRDKAEAELLQLKTVRRKEVAEKIEAAKEMGDISENAEYAAAKDEQAFLEARIAELENVLAFAQVVAAPKAGETVTLGTVVRLSTPAGEEKEFTLVGYNEANPATGRISNESPLGQALLGRRAGDEVRVQTPNGLKEYRVVSLS